MTLFSASEEGDAGALGGLHEQTANEAIADWLGTRGEWTAAGERVGVIHGSGARPDIVLTQGDRMPVIIENEWGKPAVDDAKSRLGEALVNNSRQFTEAIALGLDERCKDGDRESLTAMLNANERIFAVQLVSGTSAESARVWPDNPLSATPGDLVAYCEYAQAPQAAIDAKSEEIAEKVRTAGHHLHDSLRLMLSGDDALAEMMRAAGCETPLEAAQTVCAVWLIAIDLQNDLAEHSPKLRDAGLLNVNALGTLTKAKMLAAWEKIKSLDYLPVVDIALPSLEAVPWGTQGLTDVLPYLAALSEELNALRAKHIYNFAGELWQRLVPDREERAAHYTKPEVAELLAALGASRFAERSAAELARIDLMDAACGTGTLIGAGERALRRLHNLKNGKSGANLHRERMENHIIAIDVNGIAGALTAKRLTDMDIRQVYESSKIAVTDHPAGSLTLLDPEYTGISEVLGYRDVERTKDESGNLGLFHVGLGERGVDWALMNPPYSRPRAGREQATKNLAPLRAKAKRGGYEMSNGQAGLATDFGNLSLMRLKPGGVFAHVLPLTAAHAETWSAWRRGMETHFEDIIAVANVGEGLESMSADTKMNEMLVVATKRKNGGKRRAWEKTRIMCVNLRSAPLTLSAGYALANEIAGAPDGEMSGRLANCTFVRMDTLSPGFPWWAVGNADLDFSAAACALLRGEIYDPTLLASKPTALGMATLQAMGGAGPTHHLLGHPAGHGTDKGGAFASKPMALDMTTLQAMGGAGPTHDLLGHPAGHGTDTRGAFRWIPTASWPGTVAFHRSMWSAESKTQTRILATPTHNGHPVDIELARRMVEKRGRWFISRNLRWTSQALAFAHTRNENHGGRAWNAIQDISDEAGRCAALFYNSVFGAIVRQVYGQSTQPGRATMQVGAINGIPCPDFGADTPAARRARDIAAARFESCSELDLEPFAYCFRDENRHEIDSVVAEMLGLNPADAGVQAMLAHYRLLFAKEPNVNGRQKKILSALVSFGG